MLGRWDKWLLDQASNVPSIFFFIFLIDLGHWKLFIFIFVIFQKKNERVFAKNFARVYEKKIILGTSDAWSTSRLSHRPSELAYYIVDWQISRQVFTLCMSIPDGRPCMNIQWELCQLKRKEGKQRYFLVQKWPYLYTNDRS